MATAYESEATLASGTDTDTESVRSCHSTDRNRKRKARKKVSKQTANQSKVADPEQAQANGAEVDIEYVSVLPDDAGSKELQEVFGHFLTAEQLMAPAEVEEAADDKKTAKGGAAVAAEESEEMSKKQKRKLKRLTIAELKQLVNKPEVVEQWDVTAGDPRLLVHLKSYRNSIPVPRHWCQKRKFLQGKRGMEKPPFQLPEFIQATGIEKIRATVMEKEMAKKLKGKMKEKMQPKMGKIDIDYQVLHDAFFKFQTKPRMSKHGDTYYEGKEYEAVLREKKPGQVSDDLRKALGMEPGEPPPWLVNMQRYGPPPSYPNLKIAGLNAPIPDGASYGYHPGGWGKPPVDEFGRPLYGDVFGTAGAEPEDPFTVPVAREPWGLIDDMLMEEEEDDDDADGDEDGTAADTGSVVTDDDINAGISSISSTSPSGLATPDSLHLRKMGADGASTPLSTTGTDTPTSSAGQLFQVLEQKDSKVGGGTFGSSHTYAVPKTGAAPKRTVGGVDVSLDPSELEKLDEAGLKARYDKQQRETAKANAPEDVSDIIEEQERKRRRKADNR